MLKFSSKAYIFMSVFESRRTTFGAGQMNVGRRIPTVTVLGIFLRTVTSVHQMRDVFAS